MFDNVRKSLFESPASGDSSIFVAAAKKKTLKKVLSGQGAIKFAETGNAFVDQFGKLGTYKAPRKYSEIITDSRLLLGTNKKLAIVFILYLRLVTRIVQLFDGSRTTTVQRGAGMRHEAIMRMIDLHIYDQKTFWNNIHLFISAGSWKDVIVMLQYDLKYHSWEGRVLNWNNFGDLIAAGLENPNTANLIKKYLPQIKARKKCTTVDSQADTMIGKWLMSRMKLTYKTYRIMKSSGNAHDWQKLISQKRLLDINFSSIHGRALALLVSGKFIKNNNLTDRYTKWIEAQPVAKFTGFVHELFKDAVTRIMDLTSYQITTINKQFDGLIELGKKDANTNSSMIVVRDTSGSMAGIATGTEMSCYNIGKALALYFSAFLQGRFANAWIEFNTDAKMHIWVGNNAIERWRNDRTGYNGNTNFLSVVRLFITIKKSGIPEVEFPTGIICISDSEFSPAQLGKTNVELFRSTLRNAGFSNEYCDNFKIVLWNLQSGYYGRTTGQKFEGAADVPNVYYFSGYDSSVMAFLTGIKGRDVDPTNAEELFNSAMDQELFSKVVV